MKPGNFLWVALGTFAVGLGVLVGGFVRTGRAQDPEPQVMTCRADFPVIGLSGKEQAHVHASWVDGDGDALNLKIQFFDRTGTVIHEDTQALAPGETVSSKLDPPGRLDKSERLEFRAAVFVEPGSGAPGFPAESGCPQVLASLERTTAKGDGIVVVAPGWAIGRNHPHCGPPPCQVCPSPSIPPSDLPILTDVRPADMPSFVDARPADMPFFVDASPADMPFFADMPFVTDVGAPTDLVGPAQRLRR